MKKDVSIILPSVRPQFLETFYASAETACKKHTFEIIIPTPFDVPDEIKKRNNVKVIKTHAAPTTSVQLAIQLCNADFLYSTTDDGFLLEDVIDMAIDLHRNNLTYKDVIHMTYSEAVLDPVTLAPLKEFMYTDVPVEGNQWLAKHWGDLQMNGIKNTWRLAMHFFMKLDYFYELGGFDCEWETLNHPIHDLIFRIQEDGGRISILPKLAYVCSHLFGRIGDHTPIHDTVLGSDLKKFNDLYGNDPETAGRRIRLNYSNWKNSNDVWKQRFFEDILPTTREEYEQMIK